MDEQRLERGLRQGPPFATRYVAAPRALDDRPFDRQAVSARRLVLIVAVTALLLVGLLAGLAALGPDRIDHPGAANGWVAFAQHSPLGSQDARNYPKDILLVREGSDPHRIAGSDAALIRAHCPTFSPDGTRLAYSESTGGDLSGSSYSWARQAVVIITLDAAGTRVGTPERIPVSPDGGDACPEWSPDGQDVAFLAGDPADLTIARADGSVIVIPAGNAQALELREFAWSPRGDVIATASLSDIWLVPIDGGPARQFATGRNSIPWGLAWSPDGSRIAYGNLSGDSSVRVLDLDGTTLDLGSGFGPAWSPEGDRIAYERVINLATSASEIVVANPDGSDPHVIVLGSLGPEAAGPYTTSGVTWSPDGSRLLYVGGVDASGETALISVSATGDPAPLVLVRGFPIISDTGLSWQSLDP